MKKILLFVAILFSMNGFAQTPLKDAKISTRNLDGFSIERNVVNQLPSRLAKAPAVKASEADGAVNYYLDYMDYPYQIGWSSRFHVPATVEFGSDGTVTFTNMLYKSILPDAKIVGTLNAAGDEISIAEQEIGTAQGINLVVCKFMMDEEGYISLDTNPLVLSYDKTTGQIYPKDANDCYLGLFDDSFTSYFDLASSFSYVPAELFPAPTTHEYSYVDYDGKTHNSTVSMITMDYGTEKVIYVNGLMDETMTDDMGNVIADYNDAWLYATETETGLSFPLFQTLADGIVFGKMDKDYYPSTDPVNFNYDASSDSYVQEPDYMILDMFATDAEGNLGFMTLHTDSKIAKTGTTGIGNTVVDGQNKDIVSTEYFDLSGRRINNTQKGAAIKVMKYADGTSKTVKVIR